MKSAYELAMERLSKTAPAVKLTDTTLRDAGDLADDHVLLRGGTVVGRAASLDELFGLGYEYGQKRRERIAALELDQVNAIAKKYFSSPNYVLATVSPK